MPQSLVFHTFKEKKPEHNQQIMYIYYSDFYSSIELRWGTAYYQWVQYEDGVFTGVEFIYEPESDIIPDGCRLEVMISNNSGHGYSSHREDTLWCPSYDIDCIVDSALNEGEDSAAETAEDNISIAPTEVEQ